MDNFEMVQKGDTRSWGFGAKMPESVAKKCMDARDVHHLL